MHVLDRAGISCRNALLVALATGILTFSSVAALQLQTSAASNPIQHIVIVMQENRSFDNYFWTYPGQVGYNPNLCMPLNPSKPTIGCMKPRPANTTIMADMPHTYVSTEASLNGGAMNGFLEAANDNPNVMSYYDAKTLPYLWYFASNYVLADQFFTSAKSYSQPNHWYMISGNAPVASMYEGNTQEQEQCYNAGTHQLTPSTCVYINEAQEIQTMADLLTTHGITWKYYDAALPPTATLAKAIDGTCKGCDAYDYWNPLEAKNNSYVDPSHRENIVNRVQLFSDLKNGTFPQVSWVIPSAPISDHPPANVTTGMLWVTDIVDSVMHSQYWGSTALVVLWDDYGGFFDTVVPPVVDDNGMSFRTPALIISPYARPGYLDHTVYDFESTLKFIEWRFGLQPLTNRDASANNLADAFNWQQQPLPIRPIPLSQGQLDTLRPYISQTGNSSALLGQFIGNDPD